MLEVRCSVINNLLSKRYEIADGNQLQMENVYFCNGASIIMGCATKVFGDENESIKKVICKMVLNDAEGKSEQIGFALDEKFIRVNFLDDTKVSHLNIGDVLYEISKILGKPVLLTQCGEPKLYINQSSIWDLNAKRITIEW